MRTIPHHPLESAEVYGNGSGVCKCRTKLRCFLWKCVHGILPTKKALEKRDVKLNPMCSRCSLIEETMEHALRDCEWNSFFWEVCPLRIQFGNMADRESIRDWIVLMKQTGDPEGHEVFAMLLWSVWKARNEVYFENKVRNLHQFIEFAVNRYNEHKQSLLPNSTIIAQRMDEKWKPPTDGFIKINSDASVRDGVGTGIGVVMRDSRGHVEFIKFIELD
ncbi:hypothetical protein DH2020_013033 [Rehmannia glutinosa]|uniref:Reverse transcriptase zinc-binding domain-containing protein n=1 Tax=Rehmannia glutinosa TaxID=99300 RepID=A0ABR0X4I4_REHGL